MKRTDRGALAMLLALLTVCVFAGFCIGAAVFMGCAPIDPKCCVGVPCYRDVRDSGAPMATKRKRRRRVTRIVSNGGVNRNGKRCRCSNCHCIRTCSSVFDFFTLADDPTGPLQCENCHRMYCLGYAAARNTGADISSALRALVDEGKQCSYSRFKFKPNGLDEAVIVVARGFVQCKRATAAFLINSIEDGDTDQSRFDEFADMLHDEGAPTDIVAAVRAGDMTVLATQLRSRLAALPKPNTLPPVVTLRAGGIGDPVDN